MRVSLCTLIFVLFAAGEIIVDLAKGSESNPIEDLIYPVELSRNFTHEEICLLRIVVNRLRDYSLGFDKCTTKNRSLAEINKCGSNYLANEMAHSTLSEMQLDCRRPSSASVSPQTEKKCHLDAIIVYLEALSADAVYCNGYGRCDRCAVVRLAMSKMVGCPRTRYTAVLEKELAEHRRAACPSEEGSDKGMGGGATKVSNYNRPLAKSDKCFYRASLKEVQDILAGVNECKRSKNITDEALSCYGMPTQEDNSGALNDERLNAICAAQEALPKRVLADGHKCMLEAQAKQYQSLLDGVLPCKALKEATDTLRKCSKFRRAEFVLAQMDELSANNCEGSGAEGKENNSTFSFTPNNQQ